MVVLLVTVMLRGFHIGKQKSGVELCSVIDATALSKTRLRPGLESHSQYLSAQDQRKINKFLRSKPTVGSESKR
jgi:hypothetical protein